MLEALRFNTKTSERMGNSGKAIQAYMAESMVDRKPNRRAAYTDYYLVRKPAKFMGHDLVMIEEEYVSRNVGCCVNPGLGVTVRVNGPTDNLEKFAKENRCSFSDDVKFQDEINSVGIKFKVPPGEYAGLSCRDREANR